MKSGKMLLQVLLSMALVLSLIVPAPAVGASGAGPPPDDRSISHLAADSSSVFSAMTLNTPEAKVTPMVTAGGKHIVGLKSDGTVIAVGDNYDDQCNVGGWTEIIQVAASSLHTVGLKTDGTVVAVGYNNEGQCNVGGWTGITQVATGNLHTVGLKSDGTVVTVGKNWDGECDVGDWTGITQVAASNLHTVGLKADGTVVAVGDNGYRQCNVGGWGNITQVAASSRHTVGLKSDGTVVAAGENYSGQCDVEDWTDIVQVASGRWHTMGLRSDGSVVAVGDDRDGRRDVEDWTDIVQVAAGLSHTVGLKSDRTVVAVGYNDDGRCDVSGWTDIVQVAAGMYHTVGLKSDGTVVTVGSNDYGQRYVGGWTDIVQVVADAYHTVGLKSDGTVVAVGENDNSQCEVSGWTDITQIAACLYHTVGLQSDGTVVAAGPWTELARWNLVLALPSQCTLFISSTAGGSVITPGEQTFVYEEGTVVDLLAEPQEGYHFVNWIGDVDTISDVTAAAANITMDEAYAITANFESEAQEDQAGISAGDWIKIEYEITGWPAGQPHPEWLELEFLSVERTSASVKVTMGMSDGTEQSDTVPVDLGGGGGEAFGLAGFIIPPDLRRGDSVYFSGYGDVTIEGETTRTYAGARRRVVYASFSQLVPPQSEVQLSYYWDKETGVMVEASTTWEDVTATAKAIETNMWEATTTRMPWWLWIIVVVAVAVVAFVVYRLRKRKTQAIPTTPPDGN